MESAPTRFAAWQGNAVSRLPTGPALSRRGGFHIRPRDPAPPRGCPGRCKHRPLQWLQQCGVRDFTGGCKPAVGCRGGFHIRPGDLAAAQSPRDDASIVPYRGCNNAGFEISRAAASPPLAVGADSISARGTLRRRGFSGAVAAFSQICRAGVHARRTTAISKRNRSRRRGARRDEGIPPYGCLGGGTATLLAATFTMVRRGGPRSSRKTFSNILSRPQGGYPPYLNSELFTLNSELPTLNFRPATA